MFNQVSQSGRKAVSQVAVAALIALPLLAHATPGADGMEAAFTSVGAKVTAVVALSLGLAVIGAVGWSGIALFRKGVRAGGGKA